MIEADYFYFPVLETVGPGKTIKETNYNWYQFLSIYLVNILKIRKVEFYLLFIASDTGVSWRVFASQVNIAKKSRTKGKSLLLVHIYIAR